MRVLVLATVVCALWLAREGQAGALVCNYRYCKEHPCPAPAVADSCRAPAVYRAEHAGKCGCCPACVTLLSKGESCKAYSKEIGETPSAVCAEGLSCVRGKCEQLIRV